MHRNPKHTNWAKILSIFNPIIDRQYDLISTNSSNMTYKKKQNCELFLKNDNFFSEIIALCTKPYEQPRRSIKNIPLIININHKFKPINLYKYRMKGSYNNP